MSKPRVFVALVLAFATITAAAQPMIRHHDGKSRWDNLEERQRMLRERTAPVNWIHIQPLEEVKECFLAAASDEDYQALRAKKWSHRMIYEIMPDGRMTMDWSPEDMADLKKKYPDEVTRLISIFTGCTTHKIPVGNRRGLRIESKPN